MNVSDLPSINAALNAVSSVFLLLGYILIKQRQPQKHKKMMIAAVMTSALFLVSYLIYHYSAGSVPYPRHDWTRPVYFAVLIPHVILAAIMVPFIMAALYFALKARFDRHRKIVRWVWPVWMFVSLSGIIVYLMLYRF